MKHFSWPKPFQVWFPILLFCFCGGTLQAQYLLETGSPTFATPEPVPMGFINVANGNLHIEIPIVSTPQRGGRPFVAKMVYDSRIWKIVDNGISVLWQPSNVNDSSTPPSSQAYHLGWRFVSTGTEGTAYDMVTHSCDYQGTPYYWYEWKNFRYNQMDGTVRRFPLYWEDPTALCHTQGPVTTSNSALDASGYFMNLYTASGGMPKEVIAPDGTKVYVLPIWPSTTVWKDANGNYMSKDGSANIVDTLNRTVIQKTDVTSTERDYTVLTSQGSSTFKMYFDTWVLINTNFGVPGVTEFSANLQALRKIELPDGSSYTFTYEGAPNGHGLLASMTLPTGATVSFTHANFTDAQGNRNRWISTATYGGGPRTFTPATCGANCNKVTLSKPSSDEVVYTFTLNNGAWNTQTKAYSGSAASGTLALTVGHDFDTSLTNPVSGGSGFIRPIRTTTTLPGPSSDLVKKTEFTFDTFTYSYRGANYTGSRGDVLTVKDYAYGSGSAGSLVRQQVMTYLHTSNSNYATKNIVNRVDNAQTKDAAGNKIAEMITTYDGGSLTSVTGVTHHDDSNYGTSYTLRGNPTTVQRWTGSGSTYLSTTMTYDTTGQVLSTTDPKGNSVSLSYSNNFYQDNGQNPPASYSPTPPSANAYLTQITLPVSGTISYGYYDNSGKRAFATDQNNKTTYFHFQDSLDRPTKQYLPSGMWVQNTFSSGSPQETHTTPGLFQDSHTNDSLGRPDIGILNSDPQGTTYGDTSYDSSGRVQSVTNAYRSTSDPTYGSTSLQYDGLDRPTRLTLQDNNYQEAFYGSAVGGAGGRTTQLCASGTYGLGYPTVTKDEVGKKRQNWTDALGRLIEVDEPDSSGSLTLGTCYQYDVLGNLMQVDQGSQTRIFTLDALSRKTAETTPEGGTVNSYYTTSGGALCAGSPKAVCRSTDARSITTTYTYDAENRMAGKSYSNGDPSVTYFYDQTSCNGLTITNGKGRRTCMSDGSGAVAWTYNVGGGITTERRTVGSVTKNISYSYSVGGAVTQITYPSGFIAILDYTSARRLTNVRSASGPTLYFGKDASYAPHGGLASLVLGYTNTFAGISTTYSYNRRLQPDEVKATRVSDSTVLLDLVYNFVNGSGKNNGTVLSMTNVLSSGRTQNFTYDELNRLATAQSYANSGADCWGQSYSYDRYGNLNTVTVTKCSAPALSLSMNGNNRITNTGFSYDLAGNLTADGFSSFTWTAEDHMASTAGVSYSYDGDGQRVKKSNGKLYWYGLRGEVLAESDLSGNLTSEYIYFGARRIARRDVASGNVYYFLSDHIGSARVITNSSGTVVEESDFYPFGSERVITDNLDNHYKFTAMERDPESALDHTLYRQYSASLARWLSPDPQVGKPSDPQSWNRYPYVVNDPLMFTDPLGAAPAYDPYLVGCFPDFPFARDFGCGWNEGDPCPPGFVPIYGEPTGSASNPQKAQQTPQSVLDYADIRLGPYSEAGISYELGPDGVSARMPAEVFREILRFNPTVMTWPVVIEAWEWVMVRLTQVAIVAALADILDEFNRPCKFLGMSPGKREDLKDCHYECDGRYYVLENQPIRQDCPNVSRWTWVIGF